jgi:hypothetical protein
MDFRTWKGFDHFGPIEQMVVGLRSLKPEAIAELD